VSEAPSKSAPLPADNFPVSTLPLQPPPLPYASVGVPPVAPGPSPLSAEHLAELAAAQKRQRKVLRAISVATVDLWLTAIFAAITVAGGLFDMSALLLGLAMCGVAFNSYRGMRMLKRLDLRGPALLGFNQLLLATAISAYAGWAIYCCLKSPQDQLPGLDAADAAEVAKMFGPLLRDLPIIIYGAVIAATWIAQGLTAIYYFSRRRHLDAYLASTPQWIHDLQRAQQA